MKRRLTIQQQDISIDKLSLKATRRLFKTLDLDGSGGISMEEFVANFDKMMAERDKMVAEKEEASAKAGKSIGKHMHM